MKAPITPHSLNKTQASEYLKLDVKYLNVLIQYGMIKTHQMYPYQNDRISKEQLDNYIKRNEDYTTDDTELLRVRAILKGMYDDKFKREVA